MKRECAWCRRTLAGPASTAAEDREITHGICDECATNIEFQQGVKLARFLDALNAPLLVRDEHDNVQTLNQAASKLLGIDRRVFAAKKRGLVFECQHARHPEGCGRTIHCSGCAIRIAVQQTATTGRGVLRQPATLKQDDKEVCLLITTEKVGTIILLRIDEMKDASQNC